jgi:Amt family ammonium transporter
MDDPVGAISVHLTCGIWGTLAVGIFSDYSFVTQLIGVAAYGAFALVSAFTIFSLIKVTMGLRVSEADERRGLDLAEHNMEAYPDYQIVIPR